MIPFTDSKNQIKSLIKSGDLKYYQFYNLDFGPTAHAFHNFRLRQFKESTYRNKVLNKTFYDIEVFIDPPYFPDSEKAERPINCISVYNNMTNTGYIYYLTQVTAWLSELGISKTFIPNITDPEVISEGIIQGYKDLVKKNPNYDIPGINIKVLPFDNEIDLLTTFFKDRLNERSLFLIGFNSALFDNPYIFNRMIKLTSKETASQIVSDFGQLEKSGSRYKIPDYLLYDILESYKPVDQGGGGLGRSLPNYKLKTILKKELGTDKLDLPGGFNENYLNNIVGFLLYGLIDSLEISNLDIKLRFLELQWSLNSYNNSIMSATTGGRSLMYTFRNNLHYVTNNKMLRYTKLNKEVFYDF